MARLKSAIVVSMLEWGIDHPPMSHSQLSSLLARKQIHEGGWRMPSPDDFADAKAAGLQDFADYTGKYWIIGDHGDARIIQPKWLDSIVICNSHEIKNRVRLVRKVFNTHTFL